MREGKSLPSEGRDSSYQHPTGVSNGKRNTCKAKGSVSRRAEGGDWARNELSSETKSKSISSEEDSEASKESPNGSCEEGKLILENGVWKIVPARVLWRGQCRYRELTLQAPAANRR